MPKPGDCHKNITLLILQLGRGEPWAYDGAARKAWRVNEEELRRRLTMLRTEHRDLDAAISALISTDSQDQLQIARLKRRKLQLKDQIAMIEDYLTPDIIA